MSLYGELLTTSIPSQEIVGNEGLVDGIINFVIKIIQKIIDGCKWIWNLITGGGQGESVAETSAKVDKAVTEAPRKLAKVQEDTKKLYENIKKNKAKASPESKEAGRRIEEILSKRGQSGKTTGELLDEFNKAMSGEGEDGDQKLTWVVKDIKETNTAFAKIMTDNGIKTRDMKSVKEGAAIIVAAALQDKPLPRNDINDNVNFVSATTEGMWFAKTNAVYRAKTIVKTIAFKDMGAVNTAIGVGFDVLNLMVIDQIDVLKNIKLIPLKTIESTDTTELLTMIESDINEFRKKFMEKSYEVSMDAVFSFGKKSPDSEAIKVVFTKPKTVGHFNVGINFETFTLINKEIKQAKDFFQKYDNELARVTKFLESEKSQADKTDLKQDKQKAVTAYFAAIDEKLSISAGLIKYVKGKITESGNFASNPMAYLEWGFNI